tara:strand:+ start:329 stop:595 length:267 start_codon:yes stop_codon:yes gene_type:complete
MGLFTKSKDVYNGEEDNRSGSILQQWILAALLVYVPYLIIKGIFSFFKKKDNTKNPYHKDYKNAPYPDVKHKTYPDRNKVTWEDIDNK